MNSKEKVVLFLKDKLINRKHFISKMIQRLESEGKPTTGLSRPNLSNKLSETHQTKFTDSDIEIIEDEVKKFLDKYNNIFNQEKKEE